jgi:hypothetical protein
MLRNKPRFRSAKPRRDQSSSLPYNDINDTNDRRWRCNTFGYTPSTPHNLFCSQKTRNNSRRLQPLDVRLRVSPSERNRKISCLRESEYGSFWWWEPHLSVPISVRLLASWYIASKLRHWGISMNVSQHFRVYESIRSSVNWWIQYRLSWSTEQ